MMPSPTKRASGPTKMEMVGVTTRSAGAFKPDHWPTDPSRNAAEAEHGPARPSTTLTSLRGGWFNFQCTVIHRDRGSHGARGVAGHVRHHGEALRPNVLTFNAQTVAVPSDLHISTAWRATPETYQLVLGC